MKKRLLFLVLLLTLPIVLAQDWVFTSEEIELNLDISGKVELVPKKSSYDVQYVIANLSFVPQEGFQEEVLGITTTPTADISDVAAVFRWDEPREKELDFNLNSDVKTFNKIFKIKRKLSFPLSNLPDEVMEYTKPSETIDSDNEDIIRLASELVEGEDDLYVVAFKLGEWTKRNIEYNLSTLTESVSQPASWVLLNREGVCDELTNLFIAMNRALGIPAKFVSGMAYTNSEHFEEDFGPHGWAEVYFPGYGWVPFDITYGEFGFIDAGHIKLKESLDANDASTRFQWLGRNIDIKASKLDIDVNIKNNLGRVEDYIDINANAANNNVDFGSYNIIEATVENLRDYYVSTELILSKSREVEVIGDVKKSVILKPNEEVDVKWVVKVSDELDSGYVYTFPFIISSIRNVSSKVSFDVKEDGKKYSLERIQSLVGDIEEDKSYSGKLELKCNIDESSIYEYESSIVGCNVKNTGNVFLEDLNVCLLDDCEKMSLGITQEKKIDFNFKPSEAGAQEIVIKANNDEISKTNFVDIVVYDVPIVEINELTHPNEVKYKDLYEISFILDKKSKFSPYNLSISVEPLDKEWDINQLNEDRKFVLKMYGNELKAGRNNFKIVVKYEDKNGKEYETSKEFSMDLVNVNIFQHVSIFFRSISRRIAKLFK